MRSRTFRIWLALLLLASFEGRHQAGAGASEAAKQELTVSAAVSLKDVLDEIAQLYRVQKPSVVPSCFNLGGSGTLQRQIEQGAPVDVFISASPTEMDSLESKSLLVPGTRKDLARNRIVLIVPNDKTGIAGFQ